MLISSIAGCKNAGCWWSLTVDEDVINYGIMKLLYFLGSIINNFKCIHNIIILLKMI